MMDDAANTGYIAGLTVPREQLISAVAHRVSRRTMAPKGCINLLSWSKAAGSWRQMARTWWFDLTRGVERDGVRKEGGR